MFLSVVIYILNYILTIFSSQMSTMKSAIILFWNCCIAHKIGTEIIFIKNVMTMYVRGIKWVYQILLINIYIAAIFIIKKKWWIKLEDYNHIER